MRIHCTSVYAKGKQNDVVLHVLLSTSSPVSTVMTTVVVLLVRVRVRVLVLVLGDGDGDMTVLV